MNRRIGRPFVLVCLALVAVGLVVGGVSADRLGEDEEQAAPATTDLTAAADPYPLAPGPTSGEVQLVIFERAYSECASHELEALSAKYKAADPSAQGVAEAVGRGWASYFKAGPDAVQDGRDGCLQGQRDRVQAP